MDASGQQFVTLNEEFPPRHGGVSQFALNISRRLAQRKQLRRAISLESEPPPFDADFEPIHVPLVRRTPCPGDQFTPIRKANSLICHLKREFDYRIRSRLRRTLRELDADDEQTIFWLTYTVHNPELISRELIPLGVKYWLLFHGLDLIDAQSANSPINQWVKGAQRVVFNSRATQQLFGELGFERCEHESVCYPGVDTKRLLAIDQRSHTLVRDEYPQLANAEFIVSTACRLVRRKENALAIRGLQPMLAHHPNCYFVVAGSGPEESELRRLTHDLNVEKQVLFLGYIPEELKISMLRNSDLFLMPNRSMGGKDFEGFGISFAEASLLETCVIGGRHGGACEAISHGESGYLVDTEDEHEAISQISHYANLIYSDIDLRRRLASQGSQRVLKYFDVSHCIDRVLDEED